MMRYGKRKAAPGGGGGVSDGKLGGISGIEITRTALFLQAHEVLAPLGLIPLQLDQHRHDQLAKVRLGLALRLPSAEGCR